MRTVGRTGILMTSIQRQRVARVLTEILAPAPTVTTLLLVIAWHSTATIVDGLLWAAIAVFFVSVVPLVYVLHQIRHRRLTDHHLGLRHQRPLPMAIGIVSAIAGLALLRVLGAPTELVALVAAMIAGLVSTVTVTLFWKISIHVAVAAGTVVILALVFGPAFLLLSLLVCLTGWARVELGDHTPSQTIAGAVLGAAVAGVVFTLLR